MKKILLTAILLANSLFAGDKLSVIIKGDTVEIWNKDASLNCCSEYTFNFTFNSFQLNVIEEDTSKHSCRCNCIFDLSTSITGLIPGDYTLNVYRSIPLIYPDSLFYVGELHFSVGGTGSSAQLINNYQSQCKNTQDNDIIYFNSFETLQDTTGWNGYGSKEFRTDTPPDGGLQSLFVSGGCIIPHASIVLPPQEDDGYFLLSCWAKKLENEVYIQADKGEWSFYECGDTLYCPAGRSIMLSMMSGGIVPGAMLVDLVKIVKINNFISSVEDNDKNIEPSIQLYQNFPNPFNPVTTIKYVLKNESMVNLAIYNLFGEMVAEVVNSFQEGGEHEISWNAENYASGVYVYRIKTSENVLSRKLVVLK